MNVFFVIGVILVAVTGGLAVRVFALSRLRTAAQLREIGTYGFAAEDIGTSAPVGAPRRLPLADLAERIGRASAGPGWRTPVDTRSLRAAGLYRVTPEAFHGYRAMTALGLPALIFLVSSLHGVGLLQITLMLATGLLGWLAPALLVRSRAQRRMNAIDRTLPELVDVLIATVEAGLGFAGSLQLIAERFSGPLGQELRLTLREQSMGLSSERALSNLLERCNTPSVRAFVRAVQQGDTLGVSIATTLRNLAAETRKRRRQNAHAEIQRAPVKMLFPLVFLIFPALLIVLLYPAVVRLLTDLAA